MLRNKSAKLLYEIADYFKSGQKAIRKIFDLSRTMGANSFQIGVNDKPQGVFRKMDILLALLLRPLANTNGSDNALAWFRQTLESEKDVLNRFINDCWLQWRSIAY